MFPTDESGTPAKPGEEEENLSIEFDGLFSSLSETLPIIIWHLLAGRIGKPDQEPSDKAMTEMKRGWKLFFKACGIRYVGKGFNIELASPFWLILIPFVTTAGAFLLDFGLMELIPKPKKPDDGITA